MQFLAELWSWCRQHDSWLPGRDQGAETWGQNPSLCRSRKLFNHGIRDDPHQKRGQVSNVVHKWFLHCSRRCSEGEQHEQVWWIVRMVLSLVRLIWHLALFEGDLLLCTWLTIVVLSLTEQRMKITASVFHCFCTRVSKSLLVFFYISKSMLWAVITT